MTKLILVRGLPGSGKSTYAKYYIEQNEDAVHFEADQFFAKWPTDYAYDIRLIGAAHDWCYSNTVRKLWHGQDVVVSNTFTKMWEMERYLKIPAIVDNVDVEIVEMRTQYQNVHNVPSEKLKQMAARWEKLSDDMGCPVTVIDKTPYKHDWHFKGVNMHKGEYWYECKRCGKEDWIASYGTLEQIDNGECIFTNS